jgi:hypothetical protein
MGHVILWLVALIVFYVLWLRTRELHDRYFELRNWVQEHEDHFQRMSGIAPGRRTETER